MWCQYRKKYCNDSSRWRRVNSSCYGRCPYHCSSDSSTNDMLYGTAIAPSIWNEDDYPNPTVGETFQEDSIEIDDSWSDSGSSWGDSGSSWSDSGSSWGGSDGGFDGGSW